MAAASAAAVCLLVQPEGLAHGGLDVQALDILCGWVGG